MVHRLLEHLEHLVKKASINKREVYNQCWLHGTSTRVTPGVYEFLFCLFHCLFGFVFTSLEIDWIKNAKCSFS